MSVHTTADEKVNDARKAVTNALSSITVAVNSICINNDWGADEYNSDFKLKLMNIQARIYSIRAELED